LHFYSECAKGEYERLNEHHLELYAADKQRKKAGQNRFMAEDSSSLGGINVEFDVKNAQSLCEMSQGNFMKHLVSGI
jgi:predicted RNA binding protein with dsRBD fold (UPF0201 family)